MSINLNNSPIRETPAQNGFYFPAEWQTHRATWLSWPHKEASWPGKISSIYPSYSLFIKTLAKGEEVCINVNDDKMEGEAKKILQDNEVELANIKFYKIPTNDAWCRDHGPAFLIDGNGNKVIVSWLSNSWGNKYPPYNLDIDVPSQISKVLGLKAYFPNIIMEGGSVDFNGDGAVLTTTSCLLNPNRNPDLSQNEIEQYLHEFYGVKQVLWLEEGIVGDDTDGHIDDITRFVKTNRVITMIEEDSKDANYLPLKQNVERLAKMRLINGNALEIIEIPMPGAKYYEGVRLPASYANFYIANHAVIVPTFKDDKDDIALEILSKQFSDRKVMGIDSSDIIWGLGSFHCLSQQEPV